jgi:hypothetical protein
MSLPTTMSDTNVAPNAPPAYLYFIHQTCGLLAFSVLIFPTLILHTVLHFIPSKRPYPTWSLARGLSIASGRLYLACVMRFSLPRPQGKKDWQNKTIIQKIVGSGIETQCIRIPPAPFKWITGVALVGKDIVHPAEVPGFITFEKNGKWNEGNEPAKPGEKVIMYIAGGYVVLSFKTKSSSLNINSDHGSWVIQWALPSHITFAVWPQAEFSVRNIIGDC